jgi:plasmid maintenance system antidote protein VapI
MARTVDTAPLGVSQYYLAKQIGVPARQINEYWQLRRSS